MSKYTPEVAEFIRNNYPEKGPEYCSEVLGDNFSPEGIFHYCHRQRITRLKILPIVKEKYQRVPNFFLEDFTDIVRPDIAYYLGLVWGDGYLVPNVGVDLRFKESDGHEFYKLIQNIGSFVFQHYSTKEGHYVMQIKMGNAVIARYLETLDYKVKSFVSPTKVLATIPDDLKRFFWLGYHDADGCFHEKDSKCKMSFAGAFDQDWSDWMNLLDSLNCFGQLTRRTCADGRSSHVTVASRFDIQQIGNYLYKTYKEDGIGLPRKYETYCRIVDLCYNTFPRESGFRGVMPNKNKDGEIYSYRVAIRNAGGFFRKSYKTAQEAADVYDQLSVECFGHRAQPNKPIQTYMELGVPNYVIKKNPLFENVHWQKVPYDKKRFKPIT